MGRGKRPRLMTVMILGKVIKLAEQNATGTAQNLGLFSLTMVVANMALSVLAVGNCNLMVLGNILKSGNAAAMGAIPVPPRMFRNVPF